MLHHASRHFLFSIWSFPTVPRYRIVWKVLIWTGLPVGTGSSHNFWYYNCAVSSCCNHWYYCWQLQSLCAVWFVMPFLHEIIYPEMLERGCSKRKRNKSCRVHVWTGLLKSPAKQRVWNCQTTSKGQELLIFCCRYVEIHFNIPLCSF